MKTLYTISKDKTKTTGFWQSENKIYIDHINKLCLLSDTFFDFECNRLFKQGEKAVLYIQNGIAYIKHASGLLETLKHRIVIIEKHLKASYIKTLLKQHNGLTIHREENGYKIIIFKG